MSFNLDNQKNLRKKRIVSEINITPFVDVLLVLLIIFMITTPMMTSGINIDLPKGSSNELDYESLNISVSIKKDGSIFLQDNVIKQDELSKKLIEISNNNMSSKIYVRGDQDIDYGMVMQIVKLINVAGFSQVILVTELEK
jgi:biopolymer transport protein TolR